MSIYGADIPKSKKAILNEAYYGKNKDLIEIENLIEDMRQRVMGQKDFNVYTGTYKSNGIILAPTVGELGCDKNIAKINRLFEKIFGFKSFGLMVLPSSSMNAFTYPVGARLDSDLFDINRIKNFTVVDRQGMRFTPNNNLCVLAYIYSGLLYAPNMTSAEILAIILHEIGHNFSDAISPAVSANHMVLIFFQVILLILKCVQGLFTEAAVIGFLTTLNSTNRFSEIIAKGINNLSSLSTNNEYKQYMTLHQGMTGFILDLVNKVMTVLSIIKLPENYLKILYQRAISLLTHFSGYHDEKLADNFVTSYGYGAELSSALSKMELEPKGVMETAIQEKCPLFGAIIKTPMEAVRFILSILDVHPTTASRVESQLETLKHELKNDKRLDPKVRKDIEDQIKNIENLKKDILENKGAMPTENIYWMRRVWFEVMIKSSDNDLIKSVSQKFNTNLDQSIDKLRVQEASNLIMKRRYEVF